MSSDPLQCAVWLASVLTVLRTCTTAAVVFSTFLCSPHCRAYAYKHYVCIIPYVLLHTYKLYARNSLVGSGAFPGLLTALGASSAQVTLLIEI
jgi:hypothetical protein